VDIDDIVEDMGQMATEVKIAFPMSQGAFQFWGRHE